MAQQAQQQQMAAAKASSPYQQLKYLYQTDNYQYFYELVARLEAKVRENQALKDRIYGELEHLREQGGGSGSDGDVEKKRDVYMKEIEVLRRKFQLDVALDGAAAEDLAGQLRAVNGHLKLLLREKLEYKERLIKLIEQYQVSIMVVVKELYRLFEDRSGETLRQAETLLALRVRVMEEFNGKIARLQQLHELNEVLVGGSV